MDAALVLRVVEGHLRTYRHTWRGSVVSSFVTPVLFLAAMGLGLGSLVDRSGAGAALDGPTYLAFLAPGLMAASAMQNAAADGAWPVMAGMKWIKTYHAALATPVRPRDLVGGHIVWSGLRLTFTLVVFAGIAVAFGALEPWPAVATVAPGVLTGLAFLTPVTAFSARLDSDYGLVAVFRFGVIPLFLFSGTFFPVDQLPGWLQPVAVATPLWHGVQLSRATGLGTPTAYPWPVHALVLLGLAAVGGALAVRSFERRLVR